MAMNATSVREGDPMSEINTTPLIDVMLVLLIMLIVTLPPQMHAVKLDTPRTTLTPGEPPKPIRIHVEFDGALTWNGERIDVAQLDQRLAAAAKMPAQPEILIQSDQRTEYQYVIHVMAAAERLGLTKLGVVGG